LAPETLADHGVDFPMGSAEVFAVSHFCPASNRQGVEMLKDLRNSKSTIVLMVTEDMEDMLVRLGFVDTGYRPLSYFRGEEVRKSVFLNRWPIV